MAMIRIRWTVAPTLWMLTALFLTASPARAQSQGNGPEAEPSQGEAPQGAGAAPTTTQPRAPFHTNHEDKPTARAVRTDATIDIDGRLDEPAWMTAPPASGFWQVDPDEGAPASEPTEVRFLYDDDAIYVGAWLWDNDGQIPQRLARRDVGTGDVDLFAVHFDSYHSHRSSNRLNVIASGTMRDVAAGANEGRLTGGDLSWDPVWDVRTTVTDHGWFVEMRIPFSQLRFNPEEEQVWGLQMERKIRPQQENTVWVWIPKTEPQGQITFGHLVGLSGIKPGRRLELLPYAGGSAEYVVVPRNEDVAFDNPFRSGSDYFGNVGLDLKYRLTSNLTLDGTINPDFGQVEVDPAVINLTAFETRYEERRPFFVEGAEIFDFGGGSSGGRGGPSRQTPQILYSRRIGRAPQGSVPGEAAYDLMPGVTTILGAAKLSGKTASGWSMAALDAVTSREMALWRDEENVEDEIEVEPLTNYFAARVRRDMRGGQTILGALFTAVHRDLSGSPLERDLHARAYSGGIDFSHDFADRAWQVSGLFSPSYVTGSSNALIATQRRSSRYYQRPDADYLGIDSAATSLYGYSAQAAISKQSGMWRFGTSASATSPGYEVNDLGFSTLADRIDLNTELGYQQTTPGPVFRSWDLRVSQDLAWNFGRDLIDNSTRISGEVQLPNFSSFDANLSYNPAKLNQRLTRGGPLARDPAGYSMGLGFGTVNQARVSVRTGINYGEDDSGAWERNVNFDLRLRTGEHFETQIGSSFSQSYATAQYVTSVADPTATGTFGRRYIFADLRQNTLEIDARFNVTLTPRLTIEIFAQPLLGSGNYQNLKELRAPGSFDFTRYGVDAGTLTPVDGERSYESDPDGAGPATPFRLDNEDFNIRSLRSNAVLRWEWRPGSTLFVVWQQTRSGRLDAFDPSSPFHRVGNFRFGRDAGDLFELRPDNVFMVKLSYWLNP